MAKRTIRHALFRYTDEDGHTQVALRGETIDVKDEELLKRGDETGVFVKDEESLDAPGDLTVLSAEATDEEVLAWVKSAKVEEISQYLSENPTMASRILDAETEARDGKPRSGVEKAAEAAAGSTQ